MVEKFEVQKVTWVTLVLLLVTCLSLGWDLFETNLDLLSWGLISVGLIVLCLCLTTPIKLLQKPIDTWFASDFRTFLSIVFGSFLIVFIATSVDTVSKLLLLLSATLLARIELRTARLKDWQAFVILVLVCLSGLSLGVWIHYLVLNHLIDWQTGLINYLRK